MKQILSDLFFGEINPNHQLCQNSPNCHQALNTMQEAEEKLTLLLEGREKKLFLSFVNAQDELLTALTLNAFNQGYQLGGSLVIAACPD